MKYLKVFEGFENSEYQEINFIEYDKGTMYYSGSIGADYSELQLVPFTKSEIKTIRENLKQGYKVIEGGFEYDYDFNTTYQPYHETALCINSRKSNQQVYFGSIIVIDRNFDEWIYVRWHDSTSASFEYFKCDQLDGLIQLLKDRGVVNK
jgi:hypothetical protein